MKKYYFKDLRNIVIIERDGSKTNYGQCNKNDVLFRTNEILPSFLF